MTTGTTPTKIVTCHISFCSEKATHVYEHLGIGYNLCEKHNESISDAFKRAKKGNNRAVDRKEIYNFRVVG